jgi:hypothetical protein
VVVLPIGVANDNLGREGLVDPCGVASDSFGREGRDDVWEILDNWEMLDSWETLDTALFIGLTFGEGGMARPNLGVRVPLLCRPPAIVGRRRGTGEAMLGAGDDVA